MARQEPPLRRPATSFCEYADTKPRKTPIWFALSEDDRPLFAFAGLWTPWRGVRGPKSAPVEGNHELFGFLTTEANAIVAPIHPKAMPVILRSQEEADRWLEADTPDALALQRPLLDDALSIDDFGEPGARPARVRAEASEGAAADDRQHAPRFETRDNLTTDALAAPAKPTIMAKNKSR